MSWHKTQGKWKAQIKHRGEKQNLGSFADEVAAAEAYDAAALRLKGPDATINFRDVAFV